MTLFAVQIIAAIVTQGRLAALMVACQATVGDCRSYFEHIFTYNIFLTQGSTCCGTKYCYAGNYCCNNAQYTNQCMESSASCCDSTESSCGSGCIPTGTDCCPDGGYCDSGEECCDSRLIHRPYFARSWLIEVQLLYTLRCNMLWLWLW